MLTQEQYETVQSLADDAASVNDDFTLSMLEFYFTCRYRALRARAKGWVADALLLEENAEAYLERALSGNDDDT